MYCPNCGTENVQEARICISCGKNLAVQSFSPVEDVSTPSVEYAGFWRRFLAILIDGFILQVGLRIVLVFVSPGNAFSPNDLPMGILLFWTIVNVSYFIGMESSPRQATLGKMAMHIKVTDLSGNRISAARAAGRYFGKILSAITLLIGFVMAAFTARRQALHDLLAETLVVRKRSS